METADISLAGGTNAVHHAVIWLNAVNDTHGALVMGLHVGGHLHGMADLSASAIGQSVMANSISNSQRLTSINTCDAGVAGLYAKVAWLGVPPGNVVGCPPGGCSTPGLPCTGSFDPGLGWCHPGVGGAPVPGTDTWWTWLFGTGPSAPQAVIASPPNGAVLPGPWSGSVTLNAVDPDGRIIRADYYVNDQYFASSVEWPYSLHVSGVPAGTYKLQVVVFDNGGTGAWSSPTWLTINPGGGGSSAGTLLPWQRLGPNQFLYSANGAYFLIHQAGDGNLVLATAAGQPLWASMEFGTGGYTEMDGATGNLVSYRYGWPGDPGSPWPYWAANPQYSPGAYLRVNDDGSLRIYAANGTPICELHPTPFCPG